MNNNDLVNNIINKIELKLYRKMYNSIYNKINYELSKKFEEEKNNYLKMFDCFDSIDFTIGDLDLTKKENQFFNIYTKKQFKGEKTINDFKKDCIKYDGDSKNIYGTEKQFNLVGRIIKNSEKLKYIKESVPTPNGFCQQYYYNYYQTEEGEKKIYKRKKISDKLRFQVLKKYKYKCYYCGEKATEDNKLEIDHIIPVSKGGTNDIKNLVCACSKCNKGKANESK